MRVAAFTAEGSIALTETLAISRTARRTWACLRQVVLGKLLGGRGREIRRLVRSHAPTTRVGGQSLGETVVGSGSGGIGPRSPGGG